MVIIEMVSNDKDMQDYEEAGNLHLLLVWKYNNTSYLENNLEVLHKSQQRITIWLSSSSPVCKYKRTKNVSTQSLIQSNVIHNVQEVEIMQNYQLLTG